MEPSSRQTISSNANGIEVYIAIGSNVGDKLSHLQRALDLLRREIKIEKASPIYETAPMYIENQPAFFNAAIKARTSLPPLDLLRLLKRIEKDVGRRDRPRYGPREVDLDLIVYGVLRYRYVVKNNAILDLPHPKTAERRFVLQPLSDLDVNMILPSLGNVSELLIKTADQAKDICRRDDAVLSI